MRAKRRMIGCAIVIVTIAACSSEHSHEGTGEGGQVEMTERPTIAVTNWTERTELFMEYPLLVAGESGRFAVHVTDLVGFTPLTSGESVVVLRRQDGDERAFRGGVSRPGIFGIDVTPTESGTFDMSLQVDAPGVQDVHELGPVTVHGAGAANPAEPEEEAGDISFLKEQQWTLEFGTEAVVVRSLKPSLVVPGSVSARAGGEAALRAPVSGRIDSSSDVPVPGQRVRANSVLVRIVPRSEESNDAAGVRADLVEAEQQYGLAQQEQQRATRLVDVRALPARRLSEAEAAVISSKARLDAATRRMRQLDALTGSTDGDSGDDRLAVRAPFDGVVAEVQLASGENVEEGSLLFRIVDTNQVHVVGAVPESRASILRTIGTAELLLEKQSAIALGPAVAIGTMVEPATRTVEVRYGLDNRQRGLPVGRGVRLRLFIGEAEALPAVPLSAVVDDGGRAVVFVQVGGESFQQRPVRLGSEEGGYVHVLEGVESGERVVSRGAYLVRLAALSTQTPSHGHAH